MSEVGEEMLEQCKREDSNVRMLMADQGRGSFQIRKIRGEEGRCCRHLQFLACSHSWISLQPVQRPSS